MMYDSNLIANEVINKALTISAKLGGELAKAVLLTALEKVKETKENKTGLTTLKNLLKSKEELGVVKINKENLSAFKEKAKSLGVTFASIGSKDNNAVKIMYKTRQTNQVKECLMEMLEHEQANKLDEFQEKTVYNQINKNLDFPSPEDGLYRYEIKNTTNEESTKLSEQLKEKGIDNDIVVTSVNENHTFNIILRVNEKDKDKIKDFMNGKKIEVDKGKEQLDNLIKKAEKHRDNNEKQPISKVLNKAIKGVER